MPLLTNFHYEKEGRISSSHLEIKPYFCPFYQHMPEKLAPAAFISTRKIDFLYTAANLHPLQKKHP
jgi:hypothetical protein